MPTSYTIGKHYENFVRQLVASGRYSTASEVMRDGLRLVEEREELRTLKLAALRAEIDKGIDSGPAEDADVAEMIGNAKARGRRRPAGGHHGA